MEELNEELVESKKGLTGRSEGKPTILIPGEIESVSKRGVTVAAGTVYDYKQKKFQQDINEGLQQLTDDINQNVKHTLSEHSSEIENINEALEENIPYVIVYDSQTINIPCDPYGNYTGNEDEIGTLVRLYRGNIVQEIAVDGINIIEPSNPILNTYVNDEDEDKSAFIFVSNSNVSNLSDNVEVTFSITDTNNNIYYGKVIFNKVRQGKSAFDIWKDEDPVNRANATPAMFISYLKNVDGVYGPKYAYDETTAIADADGATVIYFIPNSEDTTKYDIILVEDGEAKPLAQEISGDITNYAGIYDVSADNLDNSNNPTKYPSLSDAIDDIAETAIKGGMTIKYLGTDGKYHQYRYLLKPTYKANFENVANWEEIKLERVFQTVFDDDKFTFESANGSAYYIRGLRYKAGTTYKIKCTLDEAKASAIDFYLSSTPSSTSTMIRPYVSTIPANSTVKEFYYTHTNETMVMYPSIQRSAALGGSLSIQIEEVIDISDKVSQLDNDIKDIRIEEDVVINISDGTEITGWGLSATIWKSEPNRTIVKIPVDNWESVTIEANSSQTAYITFLDFGYGPGATTPIYYSKGYTAWYSQIAANTTGTFQVPPLAKFMLVNKSYGSISYYPKSIVVRKKSSVTGVAEKNRQSIDELQDSLTSGSLVGTLFPSILSLSDYGYINRVINTNNLWTSNSGNESWQKGIIIPLKNATYSIEAVNGIACYAILQSLNNMNTINGTPDFAPNYSQRYSLPYNSTSEDIVAQEGWYLWTREDIGGGTASMRFPKITNKSSNQIKELEEKAGKSRKPTDTFIIAASDSSDNDKAMADFTCTGTGDNRVIEQAINAIQGRKGTVYLCAGNYYIDEFTQDIDNVYVGITINGNDGNASDNVDNDEYTRQVNIEGYHFGGATNALARLRIKEATYNSLDANAQYSIIRHKKNGIGFNLNYHLSLKHLGFTIWDNQKNITAIDCRHTSQIVMDDVTGSVSQQEGVWGNKTITKAPSINCVFFRGLFGSGNAWSKISNCYVECYGIGYAIQGEHIISESCGAINCIYGFAFNYFNDISHGQGVPGMYVHPMMIINPIEEGCFNYPYFGNNPLKQSIIITGYHNEHRLGIFGKEFQGLSVTGQYATERVAGSWYGHVDYAIQYFGTVEGNKTAKSTGAEPHVADIPFWANGSGTHMESVNVVHTKLATTAERRAYAPNFGQQVYDTDKNKLCICIDPANKTWVDMNGNNVDA